ncbi:hypothetical protein JW998_08405 [candidate division KSB1 bacterium]|nr:hypothetical protein [candidate division KSB1 bacterium]
MKYIYYIAIFFTVLANQTASSHGMELRLTLSGKILLGLAYRHQIDANTAIRVGSYVGLAGFPVGMHLGAVQDITPSKEWTPFFEIGGDMLFFKTNGEITQKLYPSGSIGLTYCPQIQLKHSVELWLGWLADEIRPVGLRYVYFNSIN